MIKKIICLICVLVSGCAVSPVMMFPIEPTKEEISKADYGEKPTLYKKVIEDYVKSGLIDPESAQLTNYSAPKKDWLGDNEIGGKTYIGWLVCVDVNAKNKYGGYVGRKMYSFIFKGNEITYAQSDVRTKMVANGWKPPITYPIECN